MFKKHEATITAIITANHKIMNDRINKISKEVEDIKDSLEFTQNHVEESIKIIKEKIQKTELCLKNDENIEDLKRKMVDMEDRSRRQNLRVDGLIEEEHEDWNQCQMKVKEIFRQNLNLENVDIDRAHRTGKKTENRSRTIILKLKNYEDKSEILKRGKMLKGTGIYINEDFSRETMEYRKELWNEVKKHRENGKISHIQYRTVIVRNRPHS